MKFVGIRRRLPCLVAAAIVVFGSAALTAQGSFTLSAWLVSSPAPKVSVEETDLSKYVTASSDLKTAFGKKADEIRLRTPKLNEFVGKMNAFGDKPSPAILLDAVAVFRANKADFDAIELYSKDISNAGLATPIKSDLYKLYETQSGLAQKAKDYVANTPEGVDKEKAGKDLAAADKVAADYKASVDAAKDDITDLTKACSTLVAKLKAYEDSVKAAPLDKALAPIAGNSDADKAKNADTYRANLSSVIQALSALTMSTLKIDTEENRKKIDGVAGSYHPDDIDPGDLIGKSKDKVKEFIIPAPDRTTVLGALTSLQAVDQKMAKEFLASIESLYLDSSTVDNAAIKVESNRTIAIRKLYQDVEDLTGADPKNAIIPSDSQKALEDFAPSINRIATTRGTFSTLIDPTMGQDANKWVSDYIRLFYFTDVKRLLKTLNPNTRVANPEASEFQNASEKATKKLNEAEDTRTIQLGKLNQLAERQAELEDQLAALRRKATATARIRTRADNEVERINTLDGKVTTAEGVVNADKKQLDGEDGKSGINGEIKTLEAKTERTAEDNTRLSDLRSQKTKVEAKLARDQAAYDRLKAEQTARSDRTTIAKQAQKDATAAASKAEADLNTAEDENTGIAGQISRLKGEISTTRQVILENRIAARRVAQDEVSKFALARDNAEFYVSPPGSNDNDPTRRVVIYGYQDSNTLLIRGNPDDVEKVKEIIAEFDRPAPQARISLYTLQINGQATQRKGFLEGGGRRDPINAAIIGVNDELRNMRTVIAIIQESLRKSITSEVGRCSRIANETAGGDVMSRLGSYYFYAPRVRRELGFDWSTPDFNSKYKINSVLQDYSMLKSCLINASLIRKNKYLMQQYLRQAGLRYESLKRVDFAKVFGKDTRIQIEDSPLAILRRNLPEEVSEIDFTKFQRCVKQSYDECVHKDQAETDGQLREIFAQVESKFEDFQTASKKKAEIYEDFQNLKYTLGQASKATDADALHNYLEQAFLGCARLQTKLQQGLFFTEAQMLDDFRNRFPTNTAGYALASFATDIEALYCQAFRVTAAPAELSTTDQLNALMGYYAVFLAKHGIGPTLLSPLSTRDRDTLTEAEYVTRWTLPDPSQGSTLGQMMFVLSLATKESRDRVLESFVADAYDQLSIQENGSNGKMLSREFKSALRRFKESYRISGKTIYPQFINVIQDGLPISGGNDSGEFEVTSNQLEVLQAVEIKARETAAAEVRTTIRQLNDNLDGQLEYHLRKRYLPLAVWLSKRANIEAELEAKPGASRSISRAGTQGSEQRSMGQLLDPGDDKAKGRETDLVAWRIAEYAGRRNALAHARPQVAAADEMIKRLVIAAETDLDYYFVQPGLNAIRQNVMAKGVELGVLDVQSMLVTNRMVARLSTDANASTTLNQATDFRDEASQLFSLADQYRSNSIKPGLATGSLGLAAALTTKGTAISPWSAAGLAGIVDILSSQSEDKRGEVYSINTNGVFKVTPIFDPSGQALRFKFDHVAQTFIQGPDGTSSRDLPRIERMSVNNDVQISNLEFKEIARFGTNSKVGTPDTRTGGVPLIRDLPIIRDIPLLGYYSRRYASAATRQESIIFAQTSVYPTVSDIVDLLLDVTPVSDLNRDMPPYLQAIVDDIKNRGKGKGKGGGK